MKKSTFQERLENRVRTIGEYILEHKTTVRETAKVFGVSKSTVHKDVRLRLSKYNPQLQEKVMEIVQYNKSVRHLHGGEATKEKYEKIRNGEC
jgi:putative DeoR family transcriptional regulator (stage III sporulation protein D)